MGFLVGVDVGTSGTKAVLVDESGAVVASATFEYSIYSEKPLWSEQDPEDWWRASVSAVRAVVAGADVDASDISGIGLTGQMHGLVMLDKDHAVIRRAILWNDQRTALECDDIEHAVGGREELIRLVKNPALTGFTAPKILWVRKNEPDLYDKARAFLLPKDYIRFRMTGEFATDVSDASGMLLLNIEKRDWCSELLDALQIDRALLPSLYEGPEETGRLTKVAAELLGLKPGIPVAAGGGDQAAGAVGNGIVRSGAVSATIGTSGVVFAHSDTPSTDPEGRLHTFCHAVPGKWHLMGVVLSAGGSFQWFRNILCAEESSLAARLGVDPYELITQQAGVAPVGSEGLIFLPYLTGERTPHADPFARGAFIGLTTRHSKCHLARSIMEGATLAMRDSLEIIRGLGVPVTEIRVSGGGARSSFWRSIQADIYGNDVVTVSASEGPAFGAALLAGVMTGAWQSVESACDASIAVTDTTVMAPDNAEAYSALYQVYRGLYGKLKGDFRTLADLV